MSSPVSAIAVIAHKCKKKALAGVPGVVRIIEKKGLQAFVEKDIARLTGRKKNAADVRWMIQKCGLVVVLGGDGTFLYAAGIFQGTGIPMLGLNFGTVGFLTAFNAEKFPSVLSAFLQDRTGIQSRMMLQADINGVPVKRNALNEITITRSLVSRALDLKCRINGRYVWSYKTDGIIISTPTGSTAYSLSSHGPIIAPGLDSIIINPICPHTLAARAMVVSPSDHISIDLDPREDGPVFLTVDGSEAIPLRPGDRVTLSQSLKTVELVTFRDIDFFTLLSRKLGWMRT